MALHRTTDPDEIRTWILEHGGQPAIIRGTTDEDSVGVLTIIFGDKNSEARRITWREFFGIFETQHLRFRYEKPDKPADAGWSYSFESRDYARETPDAAEEGELPEDIDDVDENLFPSAPAKAGGDIGIIDAQELT